MGYESKVIIAKGYNTMTGYHSKVATIDLCKMGYDNGWRELFHKPFEGEIYIEDENEPTTEDKYGEELKWATVEEVYKWCIAHKTDEYGNTYWRQELLESMLRSLLFELGKDANHFKVIHYGY